MSPANQMETPKESLSKILSLQAQSTHTHTSTATQNTQNTAANWTKVRNTAEAITTPTGVNISKSLSVCVLMQT